MSLVSPKNLLGEGIGYLKGKSAIAVAHSFGGRERNFNGERLWARGYAASTVALGAAHDRQATRFSRTL